MSLPADSCVRAATADDGTQLLRLWDLVFDETARQGTSLGEATHGSGFAGIVGDSGAACFPVVELDNTIVATAIRTPELGVPNPHCLRGRTVRLANVITLPDPGGSRP